MPSSLTLPEMRAEVAFSLVALAVLGARRDSATNFFADQALLSVSDMWVRAKTGEIAHTYPDQENLRRFESFCEGIQSAVSRLDQKKLRLLYEIYLSPENRSDGLRLARVLRDRFALAVEDWSEIDSLVRER